MKWKTLACVVFATMAMAGDESNSRITGLDWQSLNDGQKTVYVYAWREGFQTGCFIAGPNLSREADICPAVFNCKVSTDELRDRMKRYLGEHPQEGKKWVGTIMFTVLREACAASEQN